MLHWRIAHQRLFDDLPHLKNALVFRYEDFVLDAPFFMDQICTLSDVAMFSPNEQVSDHNEKYLARWRDHHASDKFSLERAFPDTVAFAKTLGYSLDAPFVEPPQHPAVRSRTP